MKKSFVLVSFTLAIVVTSCSFFQSKTPSIGSASIGKASFYGDGFHGKQTANGEIFNKYKFTAAHLTLAFGTRVKVTNLRNRKSVIVRINDRGPYIRGRIIDVSEAAGRVLGMKREGVATVQLIVLK
jgi:rare lipoprotein A